MLRCSSPRLGERRASQPPCGWNDATRPRDEQAYQAGPPEGNTIKAPRHRKRGARLYRLILELQALVARLPVLVEKAVIRAFALEVFCELDVIVLVAVVQHRVALLVLNVDVRASPEEGLHDTLVALLGGQQQQRVAVLVLDINEYLKIAPTGRV